MLVKDIVRLYSPTGSEAKLVDFLVNWANANGFRAHKDKAGNFIAEKGTKKASRQVLLVGHVDTVPGKIPVKIENRKLYGRGSVDAKGPLACFLEAVQSVQCKDKQIIIVGAVEEEGNSKGARYILNKYAPDCIIVGEPSGWSNINMGYKGRLNIIYNIEQDMVHTSSSSKSAAENAITFFNRLQQYCDEFNKGKDLFGQISLKLTSIDSRNDSFKDTVEMKFNVRTPLNFNADEFKRFIATIAGTATIEFLPEEKAVKADKGTKLVTAFLNSIRINGGTPKFKLKSGTSDMNILQAYNVPMLTYGPGDSALDHTPNEHLDLEEYMKSVNILKRVLERV